MVKEDCPLSTAANLEPTPTIPPDKLSPADVLLYRRHSLLGRLIRAFDGKEVSHASLYLGSEVAEAVGTGLLRQSLLASRGEDQRDYILAYRWKDEVGADAFRPVVQRAEDILARQPPYAHADVMAAAVLALTRKIPFTRSARFLVRAILDRAAKALLDVAAPDRPDALMCSQFVYTCYRDTPPPLAALQIEGASAPDDGYEAAETSGVPLLAAPLRSGPGIAMGSLLQRAGARWDQGFEAAEPSLGQPTEVSDEKLEGQLEIFEGELARESGEIIADGADALADGELLDAMRRLARTLLPPESSSGRQSAEDDSESAPASPSLPLFREVIANFVTPGDLSTSPSLRLLGRVAL